MNRTFLIGLMVVVFLIGCSEKRASVTSAMVNVRTKHIAIPNTVVAKSELFYDAQQSRWKLNDRIYSGYAFGLYPDRSLKEKFGILNGKKQNQAIHWFPDGHFKQVASYHSGKLNGDKKNWSSDASHVLLSHLNYVDGKLHGEQKKWYPTGELFKKMHFKKGKEEGIQQAFRKNGVLYVNYEAKNGRIFGLRRAKLCYELTDEKIASK